MKNRSHRYWTKEHSFEEAKKYSNRIELKNASSGAYEFLRRNGWLDDACSHMTKKKSYPKGYWTKAKCLEIALQYKVRADFIKFDSNAYIASQKHGWLNEICSHMKQNKHGYWTKERCLEEAQRNKSITDFAKGCRPAYCVSRENGWFDEICEAINRNNELKRTKEYCLAEAKKSTSQDNFRRDNFKAYNIALKKGWMNDISLQLIFTWKRRWSKETCAEAARRFSNRIEFQKNARDAYGIAQRKGWLEDICPHMSECKYAEKRQIIWTKENCEKEARKYERKIDFKNYSECAYFIAKKNGWLKNICSHMIVPSKKRLTLKTKDNNTRLQGNVEKDVSGKNISITTVGNRFKRCVYAFEFSDNSVYVGLTYNIQEREWSHLNKEKSAVYKHIQKTGLTPNLKIVSDYIDKEKAQELEGNILDEYMKNGWIPLNRIKTGGLGGSILFWTKERCTKEAQKYKYCHDFRKNNSAAYTAAHKMGIIDEICQHMGKSSIEIWWTKERIQEVALRYKTKTEFRTHEASAYMMAWRKKWLESICTHMVRPQIHNFKWTKETLSIEAQKYETRIEFLRNAAGAYGTAYKMGFLDEICIHMSKKEEKNTKKSQ